MAHDFSLQHHAQLRTFVQLLPSWRNVLTVIPLPACSSRPDGVEQFRVSLGEDAVEGQSVASVADPCDHE